MRADLKYVLPAVAVALIVVGFSSVWAYLSLDVTGQQGVYQEILKLSYQFLVIVLLGLLVTTSLEAARERRAFMVAKHERKENFVRSLIGVTHEIDLARLLIMANRSVRTWDTQMNERIIPAYTRLRELHHDVETASAAGDAISANPDDVLSGLWQMRTYIEPIVDEFAEHKKNLAELQRQAEQDRSFQDQIWEEMLALTHLGDLVQDGDGYASFREAYRQLLELLRNDLRLTRH